VLRILIEVVLPFLAPFLAFLAWRLLVTRGRGLLERTPWYLLTVSGLVLACLSLALLAFLGEGDPDGVYVPPHVEDGRIVPGMVRPREEAGDG
jgi:hypothetical protein